MKKLVLLASMMLAFVTVKAQSEVGGWSLRPTVGMNIGFMTNADDSDPRFGLVVGAELEYQASDMLGISGGLLYSQQGAKMKDMDMDGTMKLDYINVPVLANFYVAKGFAFKVGLQPSFLVNDKVNQNFNFSVCTRLHLISKILCSHGGRISFGLILRIQKHKFRFCPILLSQKLYTCYNCQQNE